MVEGHYEGLTSSIAYSFGQNMYGELGLEDKEERLCPTLIDFCNEKDIVDVACGNEQTALLTADGHLYTCGYNDSGQCGIGTTNTVQRLTLVSSLVENGIQIERIFSGNGCEHLAAVATTGELYTVGFNSRGQLGLGTTTSISEPSVVIELREVADVADVACSYFHTIIRATDGMLYACGRNDHGQLGIPDRVDCPIPKPIPFFNTRRVLAVSCGQHHTIVSLESGGLMAFGKNEHGQLGIGKQSDPVLTPIPVVFHPIQTNEASQSHNNRNLEPLHSRQQQDEELGEPEQSTLFSTTSIFFPKVACGYYHTVAVSEKGTVYAFGRNDFGQLGLGHTRHMLYADVLQSLSRELIVDVTCGCYHTFVVSNKGKVFPFGRNNHGQLGLNTTVDCFSPQIIPSLQSQRVQKVAAGFYHSFCLVENPAFQKIPAQSTRYHTLSHDLWHMVNNPMRSDVTFVVEGKKIYAHSFLLAARCEPMEKMLDGRMCDESRPEINIPEYSYIVFLAFMEYLYTDNVELLTRWGRKDRSKEHIDVLESDKQFMDVGDETEYILELLRLADQYLVSRLQKICESSILQLISVENVCVLLHNAHFRNAFSLKKRCLSFILDHFAAVITADAFITLPQELLQEVLRAAARQGVNVQREQHSFCRTITP